MKNLMKIVALLLSFLNLTDAATRADDRDEFLDEIESLQKLVKEKQQKSEDTFLSSFEKLPSEDKDSFRSSAA